MIDINRKLKNFGPLEILVLSSITYVVVMLLWTASTRSEVLQKANDIKSNHKSVVDFINDEVIPGTNIKSSKFWEGFSNAVHELAPINKQLLKKREDIQNKIAERDDSDKKRDISPLISASDAHIIDSTNLNLDTILDKILELYNI